MSPLRRLGAGAPPFEGHTAAARELEASWQLYDEAKQEWRWVYAKRKELCDAPSKFIPLAKWCIDEGLYDEAAEAYGEALKLNPEFSDAKKGQPTGS